MSETRKRDRRHAACFAAFAALASLSAMLAPADARAAELMTTVVDLDFGTFGLKDNDGAYTIVVQLDNNVIYDDEVVGGSGANRAEYALTGLPATTQLTVTVADSTLSRDGGGPSPDFTIGSFTDNDPLTDGSGAGTLYIGGTLTTSGTSDHYYTGPYSGTMAVTVSW